jgi:hypothetical protein
MRQGQITLEPYRARSPGATARFLYVLAKPSGYGADRWWLADERVRPVTDDERQLYLVLSGITQRPASLLAARWSEPALTVHKIEVSGPNSTCTRAEVRGPR